MWENDGTNPKSSDLEPPQDNVCRIRFEQAFDWDSLTPNQRMVVEGGAWFGWQKGWDAATKHHQRSVLSESFKHEAQTLDEATKSASSMVESLANQGELLQAPSRS